ncbi:MAG: ferritin-like domain-containing protein [Solirubrobacterales bacterium]
MLISRNRITPRGGVRRATLTVAALLVLALAGCGGSGAGTTTAVPDKVVDAEVLNVVLARELAAARAYDRVLPQLHGADLAMARRFRAQEQEHVDAILRALRGLGAEAEPEEDEEIEAEDLRTRDDLLGFLYEVERVSIDDGLQAIAHLTSQRALVGSIVANQAQHLVLLRRALGARPLATVPEAFENGTAPPPGKE